MPDWLFSTFAYFGMFMAVAVIVAAGFVLLLSLRSEAP